MNSCLTGTLATSASDQNDTNAMIKAIFIHFAADKKLKKSLSFSPSLIIVCAGLPQILRPPSIHPLLQPLLKQAEPSLARGATKVCLGWRVEEFSIPECFLLLFLAFGDNKEQGDASPWEHLSAQKRPC